MNRTIITLLSVIIVIIAIITGGIIYNLRENEMSEDKITKVAEEKIVDECTDEYEQMQEEILETNVEEKEKISPNCFKKTKINHFITFCFFTAFFYNPLQNTDFPVK